LSQDKYPSDDPRFGTLALVTPWKEVSYRTNWWVENPALETGAWRLPREKRVVFFATNVSDKPITARVKLDLADYGLEGGQFQATHLSPKSPSNISETPTIVTRHIDEELTIPPRTAWALEVK